MTDTGDNLIEVSDDVVTILNAYAFRNDKTINQVVAEILTAFAANLNAISQPVEVATEDNRIQRPEVIAPYPQDN